MVFFCPDCMYTLGINKKVTKNVEKKVVDKVDDLIKLVSSNKFDSNFYEISIQRDELTKNKKYQKLSSQEKSKIDMLFTSSLNNAELTCNNCGYRSDIVETIKLYEYNISDQVNNVRSIDDNRLRCYDPILPRTRDFTCKNVECPTNDKKKSEKIDKEAVWMRTKKNFNIEYICTTCYYSWG